MNDIPKLLNDFENIKNDYVELQKIRGALHSTDDSPLKISPDDYPYELYLSNKDVKERLIKHLIPFLDKEIRSKELELLRFLNK